ncbi:MAG: T9SS type A sorting domain-containing protein, partial [Bacteroidetes bacterium]|nr:T9SS type A sorting domain-containing protein [Bacteroidota bacterium]
MPLSIILLGTQPVFLRNVLATHGITSIPTTDGLLGTAIAISPDGNFVCGWDNQFAFFASGWIVNLDDSLISDCYITCPQDIYDVSLTGPKAINYSISTTCAAHPNASLVLASGLPSGSLFPIGTTLVVHNLVDTNGTVLNTCSFTVNLTDTYCNPSNVNTSIEPITLVNMADINNVSSVSSILDYEDFTNIIGNVEIDSSYTATFQGNTGGVFDDFFRVYIDWNQDGTFSDVDEVYDMGSITNSTGLDTIHTSGTITVPSSALVGQTTMRVIKNYLDYTTSPCLVSSGYGQTEDYTLNVTSNPNGIESITAAAIQFFPNPATDVLNINSPSIVNSISISNVLGQEVLQTNTHASFNQVNVSSLPAGIYLV